MAPRSRMVLSSSPSSLTTHTRCALLTCTPVHWLTFRVAAPVQPAARGPREGVPRLQQDAAVLEDDVAGAEGLLQRAGPGAFGPVAVTARTCTWGFAGPTSAGAKVWLVALAAIPVIVGPPT